MQEKESFSITNDMQAEWALGAIARAKSEREKWERFYEEKLSAVRAETRSTIDYMSALLQRYFETQEHRVTKSGIHKYALPSGELLLKPGATDYARDEALLLRWCEDNLPAAVKTTKKLSWAEVKAHIKATGEIPDGVTPFETEAEFQIREV